MNLALIRTAAAQIFIFDMNTDVIFLLFTILCIFDVVQGFS
jgi:hypothetical protein